MNINKYTSQKSISVNELAKIVAGRIIGDYDPNLRLTGTSSIEEYIENRITFARNEKYGEKISKLNNAVIVVPQTLESVYKANPQNTYIIVSDAEVTMVDLQEYFYKDGTVPAITKDISRDAWVAKSARIGDGVYIGENAHIGENVVIGDETRIMPGAYISDNVIIGKRTTIEPLVTLESCQIGDDVLIQVGAHVGVEGFRFVQDVERKRVRKIIHSGMVVIGNRVEIGANTTVKRSTFEGRPTLICDDVKIACTIVIGHNVTIGSRTVITCETMIAGSSTIGEDVWIGAGAVISQGINVGNRAKLLINAVVISDIPDDTIVSGFYAMPHKQWKKAYRKLLELGSEM